MKKIWFKKRDPSSIPHPPTSVSPAIELYQGQSLRKSSTHKTGISRIAKNTFEFCLASQWLDRLDDIWKKGSHEIDFYKILYISDTKHPVVYKEVCNMVLIWTLKLKTTWWYSQVSEANGFTPVEGNPLRSYVACIDNAWKMEFKPTNCWVAITKAHLSTTTNLEIGPRSVVFIILSGNVTSLGQRWRNWKVKSKWSLLRACDTPRKSTSKHRPSKWCFGKAHYSKLLKSRSCGGLRVLEFVVEDTTNAVLAAFSPRTQTSKSSDEDLRSSGLLGDAKRQAKRPRPRSLYVEARKWCFSWKDHILSPFWFWLTW